MSNHDDLERALRDRAGTIGTGEHPLSLDDVKGRARGIRRRRLAATGLAAAAVLAVAVPAGTVVAHRVSSSTELPPANSTPTPNSTESPTPTKDPSPSPTGDGSVTVVALDNNTDARSGAPGIAYVVKNNVLHTPDGAEVTVRSPQGPLERRYDGLARAGDVWLALWRDDRGRSFVDLIKPGGIVFDTRRATDTLAASADGSIAVYGTPDGNMVSFTPGDDNLTVTSADAARPGANPVGVLGSGTCKEAAPEGGGCTVFYDDNGVDPAGYYASSHGDSAQVDHLRSVGGVSADGWVDGMVSADDFGSCSVMLDENAKEQWRTCDHTLGKFSADGRYVLGYPAYRDGIGDGTVAIIDARTGNVLVDFKSTRQSLAFVDTAEWDTDGTVLATVFSRGSWSLVRMTPEGELSLVDDLGALGTEVDSAPLVLETRP